MPEPRASLGEGLYMVVGVLLLLGDLRDGSPTYVAVAQILTQSALSFHLKRGVVRISDECGTGLARLRRCEVSRIACTCFAFRELPCLGVC